MLTWILVQLVVKSQVLAGGRGLGTFKNGLKGGVHIVPADQVEDIAGTKNHLYYMRMFPWRFCLLKVISGHTNIVSHRNNSSAP